MANKNNTLTNLVALQTAARLCKGEPCPENIAMDELAAKLEHMANTEVRKREAAKNSPKTPTKEQLANRAAALELVKSLEEHGEPVTAAWISDNVPGYLTAHAAQGKLRVARSNGWLEYGANEGPRKTYLVTDAGRAAIAAMPAA